MLSTSFTKYGSYRNNGSSIYGIGMLHYFLLIYLGMSKVPTKVQVVK